MTFTLEDWHTRFQQQARWTASLRSHIFTRGDIRRARHILEVGCGTGAITASMARENIPVQIVGVDIDVPRLAFARSHDRACEYAGGDALRLPFGDGVFDLTFCHYLLLWIPVPEQAVREMVRVTRSGGWVAAFAEPDYGARIDYPPPLEEIGRRQTESLRRQGAHPEIGRRLAGLLAGAGVSMKESGVLGAHLNPAGYDSDETDSEWKVLKEDLAGELSNAEWQAFLDTDRAARASGERVWFVPTFYAAGARD